MALALIPSVEPNATTSLVNKVIRAIRVPEVIQNNNATTAAFTLDANDVTGATALVAIRLTGAAPTTVTLPTVAAMLAVVPNPEIGMTWFIAVTNTGSGTVTITTNTGWTVSGTATVATTTTRFFRIVITSISSATADINNMFGGIAA
ncbi:MAG: hypothetical protein MN733_05170 [Nitrososphaera sp.]|nr:hypothetical protein [Nitrososphaera sp.]